MTIVKIINILFFGMVFFGLPVIVANIEIERTDESERFEAPIGRKSITFIMGEDKPGKTYYKDAQSYFAHDEIEKTDEVVSSCRTLDSIIEYLNASNNARPWGVINVVAHGNPNTGLNLDLTAGGHRATPKRMLQAVLTGRMPRIKKGIIDHDTRINFWSCGIGKNPLINVSLRSIFKPESGDTARVYCSPFYVIFEVNDSGRVNRQKASYWPFYYKSGYRPATSKIIRTMKNKYPDGPWSRNTNEINEDDIEVTEHQIPVKYIKIYNAKNERPSVKSKEEKMEWIKSQPELMTQIEDSGIPIEKFFWRVDKVIHTMEDGKKVPAIRALGMTTVMNFLKKEKKSIKNRGFDFLQFINKEIIQQTLYLQL